ncbi:MAG: hypothetical protein KIPDCIKN_01469 [Haliscomenobacter sp.]|nr:hypothetical protein [Haliscomenobacter sp.]
MKPFCSLSFYFTLLLLIFFFGFSKIFAQSEPVQVPLYGLNAFEKVEFDWSPGANYYDLSWFKDRPVYSIALKSSSRELGVSQENTSILIYERDNRNLIEKIVGWDYSENYGIAYKVDYFPDEKKIKVNGYYIPSIEESTVDSTDYEEKYEYYYNEDSLLTKEQYYVYFQDEPDWTLVWEANYSDFDLKGNPRRDSLLYADDIFVNRNIYEYNSLGKIKSVTRYLKTGDSETPNRKELFEYAMDSLLIKYENYYASENQWCIDLRVNNSYDAEKRVRSAALKSRLSGVWECEPNWAEDENNFYRWDEKGHLLYIDEVFFGEYDENKFDGQRIEFNTQITSLNLIPPQTTQELHIFPNLASTELNLELQSSKNCNPKCYIFNTWGQNVLEKQIWLVQGFNREVLDISILPKGAYWISLILEDARYVGRFIKN